MLIKNIQNTIAYIGRLEQHFEKSTEKDKLCRNALRKLFAKFAQTGTILNENIKTIWASTYRNTSLWPACRFTRIKQAWEFIRVKPASVKISIVFPHFILGFISSLIWLMFQIIVIFWKIIFYVKPACRSKRGNTVVNLTYLALPIYLT